MITKDDLYRIFVKNNDKTIKVRIKSTALGDEIYRGILEADLISSGIDKSTIKALVKKGFIVSKQISMNGVYRNVYLWKNEQLLSPIWYKRLIQRAKRWLTV